MANQLLRAAQDQLQRRRRLPQSTYRLQFHAGFTFKDATAIVPYLAALGITHCYASPYLKARPGSTHGYDVIDHNSLNPELGTEADYEAWLAELSKHGMGHILDTVPNHAGVGTNDNVWWNDVLENGRASAFAHCFDIAWDTAYRPQNRGKVLIPTLGGHYADVLTRGELQVSFDQPAGTFSLNYFDRCFPIDPRTYGQILSRDIEKLKQAIGDSHAELTEYQAIISAAGELPTDAGAGEGRQREASAIKKRLSELAGRNSTIREFIEASVRDLNGAPGDLPKMAPLDKLISSQNFRLAYWRVAPDEINYRRFFDINDLAALAMEHEDVFETAHKLTFRLIGEGKIDGLRIDHPDGLYDPKQYLDRLQRRMLLNECRSILSKEASQSPAAVDAALAEVDKAIATGEAKLQGDSRELPLYVTVEKILAPEEPLPAKWACHGTSGYDFLILLNGLFIDPSAEQAMTQCYQKTTGSQIAMPDLVYEKKKLILQIALASELRMLTTLLDQLAQQDVRGRDFTFANQSAALREIIACFGVYRSYIDDNGADETDIRRIDEALAEARRRNPSMDSSLLDFIRDMLIQRPSASATIDRALQRRFAGKFQQLTAPDTAKGIEDTAFYVYNRLISLNEVGGEPAHFGTSADKLHDYLADRQQHWPFALSVLSTHDTKRSEDVRARIHVLSELATEWQQRVAKWFELNARHHAGNGQSAAPDANDEYLLYQTLVGIWPFDARDVEAHQVVSRVQAYMQKAIREAKVHTSWTQPNERYEKGLSDFIATILDKSNDAFLKDFLAFQQRVSAIGVINSLSQTLVRLAAPGVPDTYQGTELWELSLVDPDNRRPVDYAKRAAALGELQERFKSDRVALIQQLLAKPNDGLVKLFTTWRGLSCRKALADLFGQGEYIPLTAGGPQAENVFAFARVTPNAKALVVVPRLTTKLKLDNQGWPVGEVAWTSTKLRLPNNFAGQKLHNPFTGETLDVSNSQVQLSKLLQQFPVGLWLSEAIE